jgi:hypothetical protein
MANLDYETYLAWLAELALAAAEQPEPQPVTPAAVSAVPDTLRAAGIDPDALYVWLATSGRGVQ